MVCMAGRIRPVPVVVVLAALLVGLVGPCLCAARVTESRARAAHDCCDPEVGLKAAVPDCCATCTATLRAPEAAFTEKGDASAIAPPVVALPLRIAPAALVASLFGLDATHDPSPPRTILRI